MSQVIFQRLIDCAAAGDIIIANADKGRFIRRQSDQDARLMAAADLKGRRDITRQIRAVMFEHEDRRYFAFFGFASLRAPSLRMPEGLREIDATPGLFAIAITETNAMPRATPTKILDIIEAQHIGVDGYDGHDMDAISDLFQSVMFAEADINYTYTADLDRVLGAMIAATYGDGPIALSEDTLKAAEKLFTGGPEFIPFGNVLQGILSISWSGLYVDLYRCVEQLYPVPRLVDLLKQWSSTQSFGALADLLQSHLGWRPHEDESLIKLIAACPTQITSDLAAAFDIQFNEQKGTPPEIVGRQIYAMRNSLVHFRRKAAITPRSDEKWNAIVTAMIALVTEIYAVFGEPFHQGTNIAAKAEAVVAAAETREFEQS